MFKALTPDNSFSRRKMLAAGGLLAVGGVVTNRFLNRPKDIPLTPGTSYSPSFDVAICHPWTSPTLWGELSPEQFKLNQFVANPEGHLVHYTEDGGENTFPGKSLTLKSASSLTIAGTNEAAHVENLHLEGGTVSGELVRAVKPEVYPELSEQVAGIANNQAVLTGNIFVTQTSNFSGGRSGVHQIIIQSQLQGTAPMYISPPRKRIGVVVAGDNQLFTGGWFIQGNLTSRGSNSLGPGPVTIDRGWLIIENDSEIGAMRLDQNGTLILNANLTVKGAVIHGTKMQPGTYTSGDLNKQLFQNIRGEGTLTVLESQGTPPDIFQSKVTRSEGEGKTITAIASGRWNRSKTWDGELPGYGKHDENGLLVSPNIYRVPAGITIRESSQALGLSYFGGSALVLEPDSVLEIDGGMGFPGLCRASPQRRRNSVWRTSFHDGAGVDRRDDYRQCPHLFSAAK